MFKKTLLTGLLCGSTFIAASDSTAGNIIITGANIISGLGMCTAALYGNTPLVIASGVSTYVTSRACGIRAAKNPSQIVKNVHSGEDFLVVSDEVIANKISTVCTLACLAATAGIYAGRQGYMPIAR